MQIKTEIKEGNFYPNAKMPQDLIRVSTEITFKGVTDQMMSYSFAVSPANRKLATRLQKAINAGKIFTNLRVAQTTVAPVRNIILSDHTVLGRTMNADLKRLGF